MKILRVLLIAILISLVGYPAYSQESLVLYDNFQDESIDPNKWQPLRVPNEIFDVKRFIKGNRLHLMERSYGGPRITRPRIRLEFQNPNVTAIQANFKVKAVEAVGCTSNSEPSVVRAGRLSGSFFRAFNADFNVVNEVLAAIEIRRESNSLDPDGMLTIRGSAFHCADGQCFIGTPLGTVNLGTMMVGQWVNLLIQWDLANNQFIFQRDNGPEEILIYSFLEIFPTNSPLKRIGISAIIVPNCADDDQRPVGHAEVEIKDVFVNESALEE